MKAKKTMTNEERAAFVAKLDKIADQVKELITEYPDNPIMLVGSPVHEKGLNNTGVIFISAPDEMSGLLVNAMQQTMVIPRVITEAVSAWLKCMDPESARAFHQMVEDLEPEIETTYRTLHLPKDDSE